MRDDNWLKIVAACFVAMILVIVYLLVCVSALSERVKHLEDLAYAEASVEPE